MKRRVLLLGVTAVILAAVVAMQQQPGPTLPVLARALKATDKSPPAAILIELGLKDDAPTDWSGTATVQGAKMVHREGYRFRKEDKLTEPNGWHAMSRYSIRAPKNDPVVKKMEGVGSVGVVIHLAEIKGDATLTVQAGEGNKAEQVSLAKVLAGETVTLWGGAAHVQRISTAMPVATGPTENDQPAAAYGPDGTLWVAYTSYTLRDPARQIEAPSLKKQPESFKHLYHPEFAEQLWVRPYRGGKWGTPIPITDAKQDIARCAVAVTDKNKVWVIYSAHRDGNYDIYARSFDMKVLGELDVPPPAVPVLDKEVRLTETAGRNLSPVACVDSKGVIWVAYQAWGKDGLARIAYMNYAAGKWSAPKQTHTLEDFGNCWNPAIAAGPKGQVAIAYDVYWGGSYNVCAELVGKDDVWKVAHGPKFQARPSLAYDELGRLWVAYEVGPSKWGKDYGALNPGDGHPLYDARTVEVACLTANAGDQTPVATLPKLAGSAPVLPFEALKTNKYERQPRYAYPQIGIDGKGGIWLTYRRNFGSRYSSHPGSIWKTYARRLDGNKWSEELLVNHSDGLLDNRPVLLPHVSGGLAIVHNTDGRETTPETIHNEIFLSIIGLQKPRKAPELIDAIGKAIKPPDYVLKEQDDVKRIKEYRVKAAGKTYQLLRGEFHRHTEISWDGGADGSLEDMFRYAIDAASMDWIGNGDHDNGAGREYPWWLIQKWTDAYTVAKHFTPMFTYERSVSYPHGHRNCMFAKRGVLTLPRLAQPDDGKKYEGGVHPDDTKMLYKYLHELDGICASHTSATGMGTDWRDNDPVAEPVVEIYQGDRMSYEYPGAPRAGYDPMSKKLPAQVGGWKPLGFVSNALKEKGYKLGFQSSSDHWSTHISFFIVIAETHDRTGILAAIKKRHSYGATDNIILDVRSGDHMQGDEFTTAEAPALQFSVIGTGTIAKIDVIKDSEPVATMTPDKNTYQGKWTDPDADGKQHYYYIRVLQADGALAWGSPLWITNK
jgi:hypothetical protein